MTTELPLATDPSAPPSSSTGTPLHVVPYPKAIKSFVKRAGRTTAGQARAVELLGPAYLLPYRSLVLDPLLLFSTDMHPATDTEPHRPGVILEIGFGMGEATAHIARVRPDDRFLCCEVHEPGVGALLKRIGEHQIHNIRILAHDAVEVIDHMLPLDSLDGIHIFFPDPWHKKRHNKRRLIQAPLVSKLAQRLRPGGYLHCATDWEPYAQQMLAVLGAESLLTNTSHDSALAGYAPRPAYRPLTKFENRGLRLGHGVWDLVFQRNSAVSHGTASPQSHHPHP